MRTRELVELARVHEALARARDDEADWSRDRKQAFDAKAAAEAHRSLASACYAAMAREIDGVVVKEVGT